MNRDEALAAFDRGLRRDARPLTPGDRVEHVGRVIRYLGDGWDCVIWSDLDDATADAEIAAQVPSFTSLGRGFEWKLYAYDRPSDLPFRLLKAGFVPGEEETLMVAEISDLDTEVALPDGVSLRPVATDADVDLMMSVHDQAFGTSSDLAAALRAQLAADTLVAFVVMAGDEPVSAARMELYPGTGFAGLWSGGTVPGWRGRGLYRALVASRARIAATRGYRYLQVDASADSRPILERLGFHPLTTTTPYTYQP
ncbi:GNAT family N-acetyltransferase [Nonomuraea sp. C10]|uniref:GNAT family N-acetyltransferase n=1 Tax=Nonomuraea sp. C10 TaxID=2600577 RepID=UPI0011CD3F69|nr:GNAT family N-acetyltransferase [Nonomuraea sp. C10]TXK35492.1 GNAT family N-acetyltransferase [Nonomuraea sp. C10]